MTVGFETWVPKTCSTVFVVKNISKNKCIHVFNTPINPGEEYDLIEIPQVSEADIKHSLLKGELKTKLTNQDIIVTRSNIELLQFDNSHKNFLKSAGITAGLNIEGFVGGNVLVIDGVNGNDNTGELNGLPFETIEGAIFYINTHSLTRVVMFLFPGYYNLTDGITIPNTCAIRGVSLNSCIVTFDTDISATMVTMGENSRIEDVTLNLTSSSDTANLILIDLPGTTSTTSKIRTCVLNINNSNVSTESETNIYGFHLSGETQITPSTFSLNQTRSSTITIYSNGGGEKCGVHCPPTGNGCIISLRDCNIYISSPRDLSSSGVYTGVCVENNNSQVQLRTSSISGVPYKSSTTNPNVRVLSLQNTSLTGLQTIQNISLKTNDRILLAGQNTASQNGIWIVSSGAWLRPIDMAVGSNASGVWVLVNEGMFSHQKWLCISYPAIVGTNSINWKHTYSGVDIKLPVLARYTGGSPTSSRSEQGSYTPVDGDRLFLDQATLPINNGIWVYDSIGAWTRAGDMPAGSNSLNAYIIITKGTDMGLSYICTTTGTVGTDNLTFVRKYNGSDILQKAPLSGNSNYGIMIGPGVDLVTKTAGGKPFTTYITNNTLVYGYRGNIPNGTRYLWQGLQTTLDTTQIFHRFSQDTIVNGISLRTRDTALGTAIIRVTILKSLSGEAGQGIATPIYTSVTDGVNQSENFDTSIMFERGSFISVQLNSSAGVSPGDLTVEIDTY